MVLLLQQTLPNQCNCGATLKPCFICTFCSQERKRYFYAFDKNLQNEPSSQGLLSHRSRRRPDERPWERGCSKMSKLIKENNHHLYHTTESTVNHSRPDSSRVAKIELKDVRAQTFPRTDFFKTFTAGRKSKN